MCVAWQELKFIQNRSGKIMKKKLVKNLIIAGCCLALIGCGKEDVVTDESTEESTELETSVLDELMRNFTDGYLYVGEEDVTASGRLSSFLEDGFTTDIDLEQQMSSCMVSDEFTVSNGVVDLALKVVNPYENTVAVKDCTVCYVRTDDVTGTVKDGEGFQCGTTTFDEVKDMYKAAYTETSDELVYKTNVIAFTTVSVFGEEGEKIIEDNAERDVIYSFDGDVLSSIEIKAPVFLYTGMQDNIAPEKLDTISSEDMSGAFEVKTTVLDGLIDAFNNAEVDINLNQSTGGVNMDNTLLFATDEYELSEEGKAYLDEFFNVYASVMLSDENLDNIEGIVFEGHTDDSGTYEYNLELSQKRAEAVLEYCLESDANGLNDSQKSTLEELAETVGYSFTDPVYDESGNVDQDASRRVAVNFYVDVE